MKSTLALTADSWIIATFERWIIHHQSAWKEIFMNSRERIKRIFDRKEADRCGFWLGNPKEETWEIYEKAFGSQDHEKIRRQLKDDFRWIPADGGIYRHPEERPVFDMRRRGKSLSAEGAFADCEDPAEVEEYEWPNPDYFDFTPVLEELDEAGEYYRASGFWCPFFHLVADFFGMENYFIKMYTHADVVHAVTRRLVEFYLEANKRFFEQAGDKVDGFFFGNDFGSQLDLLVGPKQFEEFIFPYFRMLTEQGHEYGYQVILHSCGSIHKVIPHLIDLGVDALHPLQAKAAGMDAETLRRDFSGKVAFLGGIDTQDLLVRGAPEEIKAEVRRVKDLLGPYLVISPSHEALLANVPPENVTAMSEAALEE